MRLLWMGLVSAASMALANPNARRWLSEKTRDRLAQHPNVEKRIEGLAKNARDSLSEVVGDDSSHDSATTPRETATPKDQGSATPKKEPVRAGAPAGPPTVAPTSAYRSA